MAKYFKIISFGRVGTKAINVFLDDHPELSVPVFSKYDDVMTKVNVNHKSLPIEQLFKPTNLAYRGITLHQQRILSSKAHEKYIRDSFENIESVQHIHLVRNPFSQVLGWINYINMSVEMNYLNWKTKVSNVKELVMNYPNVFETLKVGRQYDILLANKSSVHTIDFPTLFPDKIADTMAEVYGYLGVDASHSSPQFFKQQNEVFSRFLTEGLHCDLLGHEVSFHFLPEENYLARHNKHSDNVCVKFSSEEFFAPLKNFEPIKQNIYFMIKSATQFNMLPSQIRTHYINNRHVIAEEVRQAWAAEVNIIMANIAAEKMPELSPQDHDLLSSLLKKDLEKYKMYQPEIVKGWGL